MMYETVSENDALQTNHTDTTVPATGLGHKTRTKQPQQLNNLN